MAIREVTFRWSDEKGECEDCGAPAAYSVTANGDGVYCSVCAATYAADGYSIVWLYAGEYAE